MTYPGHQCIYSTTLKLLNDKISDQSCLLIVFLQIGGIAPDVKSSWIYT